MRTERESTAKALAIDRRISAWVRRQKPDPVGGNTMIVGIRSIEGPVYRTITTEGLFEFMGCCEYLRNTGLSEEFTHPDRKRKDGYDIVFFSPDERPPF